MKVVIREMLRRKKTKRKVVVGGNKSSNTEKRILLGKSKRIKNVDQDESVSRDAFGNMTQVNNKRNNPNQKLDIASMNEIIINILICTGAVTYKTHTERVFRQVKVREQKWESAMVIMLPITEIEARIFAIAAAAMR